MNLDHDDVDYGARLVGVLLAVLVAAVLLSGCARSSHPSVEQVTPVCDALVGPIHYNSTNLNSRRHAGPDLAPDLAQRNRVGMNLRCPKYR